MTPRWLRPEWVKKCEIMAEISHNSASSNWQLPCSKVLLEQQSSVYTWQQGISIQTGKPVLSTAIGQVCTGEKLGRSPSSNSLLHILHITFFTVAFHTVLHQLWWWVTGKHGRSVTKIWVRFWTSAKTMWLNRTQRVLLCKIRSQAWKSRNVRHRDIFVDKPLIYG